jgi:hypothetical protein
MANSKASGSVGYRKNRARKPPQKSAALPKSYGSLRGQFVVRDDIDLTKPIYEQALKASRKPDR